MRIAIVAVAGLNHYLLSPAIRSFPANRKMRAEQSSLEQAAIEAGVIPDARTVSLAGAFERQSDLGTDRFCAVGSDETGYQVGMIAVFGPDSKCEGLGEADRTGRECSDHADQRKALQFYRQL